MYVMICLVLALICQKLFFYSSTFVSLDQSMPLQRPSLSTSALFLLPLVVLALIAAFNMATKPSNNNLNGKGVPASAFPFGRKTMWCIIHTYMYIYHRNPSMQENRPCPFPSVQRPQNVFDHLVGRR